VIELYGIVIICSISFFVLFFLVSCIELFFFDFCLSSFVFFPFFLFGVHLCCMWVEVDVLWGNCSVLCRMYEHGKEVVRE